MKKVISLLLVVTMLFTACKSDQQPTDNSAPNNQNEFQQGQDVTEGGKYAEKQVYRYAYSEEATTLNYLTSATQVDQGIAAKTISTLVEYDKYGIIKPGLAEKWEVSDDGLTWTFNLRKGAMWVDYEGNEVAETTARDFVSAAQYLLTPSNESETANMFYSVIKNAQEYFSGEIDDFSEVGVKAIDDYTLEYTLKAPIPYFESMLTYVCFFPAYGPMLEEMGDQFGTSNTTMYFNGGFILTEFEPQAQKIYKKNPKYWDKENIFLEELNYKYNKESVALGGELYKRGEVTHVNIPVSNLDEWMNNPELKDMVRPDKLGNYSYFYVFNFKPGFSEENEPKNWEKAVNNLNFRNSIKYAFNRVAAMMTEDPYNPEYRIINTITPPNFVSQNGKDFTMTSKLSDVSNGKYYDEAEAKKFKEAAINELKEQGVTFPVKVVMPYNTGSSYWAQEAQVVKQGLETSLGTDYIQIVLLPHAPTGFLNGTRRAGNYGLMKVNWGPDYADPQTFTDPFKRDGNYNFPEYTTSVDENGKNIYEKYETLVNEAKSELIDLSRRYELFAEAEALLLENAFVLPYNVSGSEGYVVTLEHPFEIAYAPFGISNLTFKGQKLLAKPMNTEEFNKAQEEWKTQRASKLMEASK